MLLFTFVLSLSVLLALSLFICWSAASRRNGESRANAPTYIIMHTHVDAGGAWRMAHGAWGIGHRAVHAHPCTSHADAHAL